MTDQQVGKTLDALGVTLDLAEGQHITDAILIAKLDDVVDGTSGMIALGSSDNTDMITQIGLITVAQTIVARAGWNERD